MVMVVLGKRTCEWKVKSNIYSSTEKRNKRKMTNLIRDIREVLENN